MHFNGPFLYRSSFHAENEQQETERALDYLDRLIQHEGPTSFAAIILESVPGTAGIMVPPPGYLAGVREICDQYGIVFIADEVMAGFGRTGKWFAIEHFDVTPDLMTFAKGVTSGYVPLGGVAINDAIAATFADRAYPGGLTYSGHPLATAARRRDHQRDGGRGHGGQRRPDRQPTCSARACRNSRPGTRRSARSVGSACSGRSSWWPTRQTREPLAPYGGSSPAMNAVHRGLQVRRPAAVRELQPDPRGAAVQHHRRRGRRGPADPRRGADGGRRIRQLSPTRPAVCASTPRQLAHISAMMSAAGWMSTIRPAT